MWRFIVLGCLLLSLGSFAEETKSAPIKVPENFGSITVHIYGLRNADGHVRVALFSGKSGFPNNAKKALIVGVISVKDGTAGVRFDNIPPGEYAVSTYHDENDNKELDEDQSFKPTEGFGTSKDAQGTLGPPKYQDASFPFTGGKLTIKIHMRYL